MKQRLDYSVTEAVLQRADSKKDPGEVHGILCGLLCTDHSGGQELWIDLLFDEFDPQDLLFEEVLSHIQGLQKISQEQINDPTCDFHLLVPDDDYSLEDKILALGDWCQGFLFGLNAGGITDLDELPEDSQEIIKDMIEIGRIGTSYDYNDDEEDESAYEQFVEYIRMGVLLIYEELHPNAEKAKPTFH